MRRRGEIAHVKAYLSYQFLAGAVLYSWYLAQPCNDFSVGQKNFLYMPIHLRDFLREKHVA